jgi:hypothetical protein
VFRLLHYLFNNFGLKRWSLHGHLAHRPTASPFPRVRPAMATAVCCRLHYVSDWQRSLNSCQFIVGRHQITRFQITRDLLPPYCAVLCDQYSVATFATARFLSCLHSPLFCCPAVTMKHILDRWQLLQWYLVTSHGSYVNLTVFWCHRISQPVCVFTK